MVDWWAYLNNLVYIVFSAIVGAFVMLIRKVLTNEKEIGLLKQEIKQRQEDRKLRDEQFDDQLREIRSDVKQLIGKMSSDYRNDR